jgi:uncharacterized protein YbaR (Trm112 family)
LCKGPLEYDRQKSELCCRIDRLAFPIRDGIPVMLIDEAVSVVDAEAERLLSKAAANGISPTFSE